MKEVKEAKVYARFLRSLDQQKFYKIAYKLLLQAKYIISTGKPTIDAFTEEEWATLKGERNLPTKEELLTEVSRIREQAKSALDKSQTNDSKKFLHEFVLSVVKSLV